jgi:hypothetical protein
LTGVVHAMQLLPSSGGLPHIMQQSWPVGHWLLLVQPVMNKGAGTRSLGAWACPPKVARNAASSDAGAAGAWAMSCVQGMRAKRAKRTKTGFFMGFISFLTDRQETGPPP